MNYVFHTDGSSWIHLCHSLSPEAQTLLRTGLSGRTKPRKREGPGHYSMDVPDHIAEEILRVTRELDFHGAGIRRRVRGTPGEWQTLVGRLRRSHPRLSKYLGRKLVGRKAGPDGQIIMELTTADVERIFG